MAVIDIEYAPRRWAMQLHDTARRFIVLVIHRRGGKTTASLQHLVRDALRSRNTHYAYVAPYRNQAKRIAWGILKNICRTIPLVKVNETDLIITLPNRSTISLYGADYPDALRGLKLHGIVLDEYAQMSPIVFSEIVTKCVADTLGYVIIIGTPKGKNHFFRTFQAATREPEMWLSVFKTLDNSLKEESGEVIQNLRTAYQDDLALMRQGLITQAELDQEWHNSWEAAIKGAVYGAELAKARSDKRVTRVPYLPGLPVYTVWDLGIGDAMSIGFFQKPSKLELHLIDYYENTGLGLPHYAAVIKKKEYVFGRHFFPFDIKNKELSTGKTRLDSVEKLFGEDKVDVVPKVPVEDGIDLARAMWSRLWISNEVDDNGQGGGLFEDLIGSYIYEYDETRGIFKSKPKHDFASHAGDMLRYTAIIEDQFSNEPEKEKDPTPKIPYKPPGDEFVGDIDPETADDFEVGWHPAGPKKGELGKM